MIFFVGAGSGAADLITVRGARLLERADVVVWAGSLVNPELLSYCKPDCEIYDSATMTLEETDAILQRAHRAGKICVRLHTGDPAIFGAIREQMERLDAADIPYEVVPGVSSLFAAAAALKKELTVPGVSQTVIISRMEGRTPVPAREKIASLATHGATMVLFLSSGTIPQLVSALLLGGAYTEHTPCAVVYKVSWQDEKIVRGTLADIAQKAADAGITKTALVLVGDFLGDRYELSKLYDKHFSTAFRAADALPSLAFDRIALVCFSEKGAELAEKIHSSFPCLTRESQSQDYRVKPDNDISQSSDDILQFDNDILQGGYDISRSGNDAVIFRCFGEVHPRLSDICAEQFAHAHGGKKTLLVFVGASGIAVRAIVPFVQSKATDPAVVGVDEAGRFVIPLLSGHVGGANEAAQAISAAIGAVPVVTTATDTRGAWAIDLWAKQHGWQIPDLVAAKNITAAVLAGKKIFSVGIGCKKGTDSHALSDFVREVFVQHDLPLALIGTVASIDLKKDERALTDFAGSQGVPFVTFSAETLRAADAGQGQFSSSDFVQKTTGVDCVCERAAVCARQTTADWLLVRKTARNGMTVAVAVSA